MANPYLTQQLLDNSYELSSYEMDSVDAPLSSRRPLAYAGPISQSRAVSALTRSDNASKGATVGVAGASKGGAQFNLKIVRYTKTLTVDLPVILWGYYEFQSKYVDVLGLPSGVTCSVAPAPNNKDLRFTFTDGDTTDLVDVICQEVPYLNLLTASGRGLVELSKIRASVPSDAQLIQFDNKLETNRRSMFGKAEQDSIVPQAFKTELQQQNTIISLPVTYVIDEERFMRIGMAYNSLVTVTTFSLALFARFFDKRA